MKEIQEGLAAAKLSTSELGKLQERQRVAIERSIGRAGGSNYYPDSGETSPTSPSYVHPDLQDLQFGALGADQKYETFTRWLECTVNPRSLQELASSDTTHKRPLIFGGRDLAPRFAFRL